MRTEGDEMERTAKINGYTITIKNCGEPSQLPCQVEIKKGDKVVTQFFAPEILPDRVGA
jgi:hypothetical protein